LASTGGGKILGAQVAIEGTIIAKICLSNRAFKLYAGKVGAARKSVIVNSGNAGGYGYTGQAGAIGKSAIPNAGNVVEIALNNSSGQVHPMLNLYPVRN
jgi:hypothetical protein